MDGMVDRKSTRLNSSHTVIYTLSLHDALPISGIVGSQGKLQPPLEMAAIHPSAGHFFLGATYGWHGRSEEHTSELQSHSDLHSFPTRRSSDLWYSRIAGEIAASPRDGSYPSKRWSLLLRGDLWMAW